PVGPTCWRPAPVYAMCRARHYLLGTKLPRWRVRAIRQYCGKPIETGESWWACGLEPPPAFAHLQAAVGSRIAFAGDGLVALVLTEVVAQHGALAHQLAQ